MTSRIAIVTGGNRGIGLAICQGLAKLRYHVVLTSRDAVQGEAGAEQIRRQGGDVAYHPLDVSDAESIQKLADFVKKEYGRVDALVNNAAIYNDSGVSVLKVGVDTVRATMETNLYGPLLLCQIFVPLMMRQNYGRVVNLSTDMAILSGMSGRTSAYRMSKTALNALSCILAAEVQGYNIKVNTMSPGWVRTEMGGSGAPLSPEEGADTAIWLATLADDGPSGGFFRDRKVIPW